MKNIPINKSRKRLDKEQKMIDWFADYFGDVIMPTCHITGYHLLVELEIGGDEETTFSVKVNFPYRKISLFIGGAGKRDYENKEFDNIRIHLFHEAFHIIHWNYKVYAESRFIHPDSLYEIEEDMADQFSFIVDNLFKNK